MKTPTEKGLAHTELRRRIMPGAKTDKTAAEDKKPTPAKAGLADKTRKHRAKFVETEDDPIEDLFNDTPV